MAQRSKKGREFSLHGKQLFGAVVILVVFGLSVAGVFGASVQKQSWAVLETILTHEPEQTAAQNVQTAETGRVERVVDGDTFILEGGARVRLIGVDTPESVDPRKPTECFAKEASQKTKDLIEGRVVELMTDASQGDVDKYGRLLRYVAVEGEDLGQRLISAGYAREYTYDTTYAHQAAYKEAMEHAQQTEQGLWRPGACK